MRALAEQRDMIGTYRTCIHWLVDVSQDKLASKHMMKTDRKIIRLRFMFAEQLMN